MKTISCFFALLDVAGNLQHYGKDESIICSIYLNSILHLIKFKLSFYLWHYYRTCTLF